MYPAIKHSESYKQPTPVHLQVYDGMLCPLTALASIQCSFLIRCSSCPSNPLSLHDSRKVLLPRDGFVRQARYHTASGAIPPQCSINTFWSDPNYRVWFHRFPFSTHANHRGPESSSFSSKATQIPHLWTFACCEPPQTTCFFSIFAETQRASGDSR
jgi:hypothetical protein